VRRLGPVVVSCLARVEVPAALWRKQRLAEISSDDAELLSAAFVADYRGTREEDPRFTAIALTEAILDAAAEACAVHGLRAYDGIQLATAVAARSADPGCAQFVCFDVELSAAAGRAGFETTA
jgi:predicted nucleic acid-binding protein